jgi:hypothetical protein
MDVSLYFIINVNIAEVIVCENIISRYTPFMSALAYYWITNMSFMAITQWQESQNLSRNKYVLRVDIVRHLLNVLCIRVRIIHKNTIIVSSSHNRSNDLIQELALSSIWYFSHCSLCGSVFYASLELSVYQVLQSLIHVVYNTCSYYIIWTDHFNVWH